jgi:hypothetical protein
MAMGSTQPLTEMGTMMFPGGKGGWRVGLTILLLSMSRMSENVGASTSRNPNGLHGLYSDSSTTSTTTTIITITVSNSRCDTFTTKLSHVVPTQIVEHKT